ncbi:hypothetical protein F53441_11531 [Fusarium austroafricanum]|uniref:Uncharacterized protein n=1 Tax=Fusarium austroafricanum TaxID=2364996 RepID=A0A8H4NZH3_9HYPO|nr:hypothetical protein F53441_11531 [Fusarium austroafricanum]
MRLQNSQLGDAYQDDKKASVRGNLGAEDWEEPKGKYLSYVKSLSSRWPQLELVADFMEVGTIPTSWCIFPGEEKDKDAPSRYAYPENIDDRRREQRDRAKRMNVALLKFKESGYPDLKRFRSEESHNSSDLEAAISEAKKNKPEVNFSLFVVEDLSRDVIETLGAGLAIDPRFFRAHITDYVWNNIRDRWREPSLLQVDVHRQKWFQMRLVRSRYFSDQSELNEAKAQVSDFNVMRRIDADRNQIFWDKDPKMTLLDTLKGEGQKGDKPVDAKVGHLRSRATFWFNPSCTIGVLLLEPTPKAGYSLWRGYPNWDEMPEFDEKVDYTRPSRDRQIPPSLRSKSSAEPISWFEDYIFWAQRTGNFEKPPEGSEHPQLAIPVQCLLHLVCGEWLTFADYLNARLNQVDWGISNPSFFPNSNGTDNREQSLRKLHFWRRWVPQARDMLQASISQVIECDHMNAVRIISKAYAEDLKIIKNRLEDYERRIDRLGTVVNSAIGLSDARNSRNLTILASLFIPPSLVATIMSMTTSPLIQLSPAIKYWAIASAAAVATLFALAWFLKSKHAKKFRHALSLTNIMSKLNRGKGNVSSV